MDTRPCPIPEFQRPQKRTWLPASSVQPWASPREPPRAELSAGARELGALAWLAHRSLGVSLQVRLQVQSLEKPQYRGTLHCFQSIIKQESVSGLGLGWRWGTIFWNALSPRRQSRKRRPSPPRGLWASGDLGNGKVRTPRPRASRTWVLAEFGLVLSNTRGGLGAQHPARGLPGRQAGRREQEQERA